MHKVNEGNCLDVMRTMDDNSVDAIVTDPPYGLSFMGKKWDYDVPAVEIWAEALRVLKPGGHLLAFAGTRTQHRMCCNIEDGGFEIRDMIAWVYSTGFPKSLNIEKALQSTFDCGILGVVEQKGDMVQNGTEKDTEYPMRFMWRVDLSEAEHFKKECKKVVQPGVSKQGISEPREKRTKPEVTRREQSCVDWWRYISARSGELQRCALCEMSEKVFTNGEEGWICSAAPFSNGESYRAVFKKKRDCPSYRPRSTQQHPGKSYVISEQFSAQTIREPNKKSAQWLGFGTALKPALEPITVARKPFKGTVANNVLEYGTGGINIDGCRITDGTETGNEKPEYIANNKNAVFGKGKGGGDWENTAGRFPANLIHDGSDEATEILKDKARFFYCAKASKKDRDEGLTGPETSGADKTGRTPGSAGLDNPRAGSRKPSKNNHPTVKPTELMRYLCRLVTPPGGIILDPFCGSGSTGKAAVLENFQFIGIEMDPHFVEVAQARIDHALWGHLL